jgi:NADPH-dependent 2,4-dienoyl-CoA reductase/sulfur reductase-like enzyme
VLETPYDVLIVGMGPAGIAAACAAAGSGIRVGAVDDNPAEGGQIWRSAEAPSHGAAHWIARFRRAAIERLTETQVIAAPEKGLLLAERHGAPLTLRYKKLILATGARERFLPFPGWTLPHVMGAGGLQALVKGGLPIAGRRVVVAGSGPLLLAAGAFLRKRGAEVACIAEQAPWTRVVRFGLGAGKYAQAAELLWALRGVPLRTGCWPVSADPGGVILKSGAKSWREPCDFLACGFGLVPNIELALVLACRVEGGLVHTDEWLETSVSGVYCAGEPLGIGGVELALAEGQIAGFSAAGRRDEARDLFAERGHLASMRGALERGFSLRPELRSLPQPETIVCRCEDVTYKSICEHDAWRPAKLQTRCGMGPCQGRVCGPAIEFLLGWPPQLVRPPVFPARLGSLGREGG